MASTMVDFCPILYYYMNMIETRTMRMQLKTTPEQSKLLLQTLQGDFPTPLTAPFTP